MRKELAVALVLSFLSSPIGTQRCGSGNTALRYIVAYLSVHEKND
jgi:hypothetical protein